ncbi:MAG: endonuclease/exonuclease/phosphatase family protein [Anaerolineales bacterium]
MMAATVLLAPVQALMVLAYLAGRFSGSTHWVMDASAYILPWVLAPAIVLLPGAIWRRSPFLLGASALPLMLFGLIYHPLFLPQRVPEVGESFTVMTYNVFGNDRDHESALESILELDPDVVALQEVTTDFAQEFEERLGQRYPYRKLETETWGQALLSRFPIEAYEVFELGDVEHPMLVQYAELTVNERSLGLLNVHTHSPGLIRKEVARRLNLPPGLLRKRRDWDMRELLQAIEPLASPLILAGDLNISDQHDWYRQVTERFQDAHREAGWGMGFTRTPLFGSDFPMWRIDFVFYTPELVALSTTHGEFGGSDHRPVVAELTFRE